MNAKYKKVHNHSTSGVGTMSNDGVAPYQLMFLTTTGFVALQDAAGTIQVHPIEEEMAPIHARKQLKFWSCKSKKDASVSGDITLLHCNSSALTQLDLSQCQGLQDLVCEDNQIKELDVSRNSNLRLLHCARNGMRTLTLGELPLLSDFNCSNNQLTSLDITGCKRLGREFDKSAVKANPLVNLQMTGAQLESGLFFGQLGTRGTLKIACGKSFGSWVRDLAKKGFPAWNVDIQS